MHRATPSYHPRFQHRHISAPGGYLGNTLGAQTVKLASTTAGTRFWYGRMKLDQRMTTAWAKPVNGETTLHLVQWAKSEKGKKTSLIVHEADPKTKRVFFCTTTRPSSTKRIEGVVLRKDGLVRLADVKDATKRVRKYKMVFKKNGNEKVSERYGGNDNCSSYVVVRRL